MGLVDRVLKEHRQRSWPVGKGALTGWEGPAGHDQSEFSPEEYGDYLATSNDIYSIVQLRARMLGALKLGFFLGDGSDKADASTSPAAQLWRYVNPYWTRARLARMDELCMGTWGETYHAIEYDRGQPKEIWWLKPSRVQPVPDETGYIKEYAYESVTAGIITFKPHEINWYRYPNPIDEFSPLSPLAASRLAADTSTAMMRTNRELFAQGMQAAGIIVPSTDKVTFTKEQADDLDLQLKRKLTGSKNAHKWAVLRYEAQFKQLSISPKDAEFISGLGMTFSRACRAYGIHPVLLGQMDGATLANVREFQKGAWETSLGPDADFRAEDVREQFLPRFRRGGGADHVEYDYSKVPALQEAESQVWTREAQALDRGAITINEWRKRRGMPPVLWGDVPYMPVNKAPLNPDGSLALPAASGSDLPDDEVNPANAAESPRMLDHMAARRLLAEFKSPLNGWSHR